MHTEEKRITSTKLRDNEFVTLFNETLKLMVGVGRRMAARPGAAAPRREAIRFALACAAPRYDVQFKRAYDAVGRVLHGKRAARSRERQAMWEEMAARVKMLMEAGVSRSRAVDHVLQHCRASRIYLDPKYAYRYSYRAARERRERLLRRFTCSGS